MALVSISAVESIIKQLWTRNRLFLLLLLASASELKHTGWSLWRFEAFPFRGQKRGMRFWDLGI